jgi:iron complex outermembrane recepter protein
MNNAKHAGSPSDESHALGTKWHSNAKRLALLVPISLLLPPTPAALSAEPLVLEEVIVTARRREETAQQVPIAVTSFTGSNLTAQGAATIIDISFHTPNMMYTESLGNNTSLRPTIRGQNQNDIIGTLDASVGTYIDDVIWARPVGSNMPLSDIARVEVLRGPQGTLFGRNTTGGAVQIYTNDPEFDNTFSAGATVGNYDRINYNLIGNLQLIENKLALRATYDSQKRDGWQDNVVGNYDINQDDKQNTAVKLFFAPTAELNFLLKVDKLEGDYRGNGSTVTRVIPSAILVANGIPEGPLQDPYIGYPTLAPITPETDQSAPSYIGEPVPGDTYLQPNSFHNVYEGLRPHTEFDNKGISLISNWDFSEDIALKLIAAHRELDYATSFDLDGAPARILETETRLDDHEQDSVELLLNGTSLDTALDWTLGLFAFEETGTDGSDTWSAFGRVSATDGDTDNSSQAVFGQATYHINDSLNLTLGLRYSEESKDLTSRNATRTDEGGYVACAVPQSLRRDPSVSNPTEAQCVGDFDRDDDSTDYTAMIDYTFEAGHMVYLKAASGIRSGGQNLRGTDELSFRAFAPEDVNEYEIGMKADWLDNRLRTNLAYFYADYSDIQRSTIVPSATSATPSTVVSNAASGTVQGIEAEVTALLGSAWQLGVTGGWTDASYDDFMDFDPLTGEPVDRSNEDFPSTPEFNYSLWASYDIDLPLGHLTARADYSWHDDYTSWTGDSTAIDTPATGLLNARLMWELSEQWELSLWGKNLTDEDYRIAGIQFYDTFGMALGVGNEPLTYGLDINYYYR